MDAAWFCLHYIILVYLPCVYLLLRSGHVCAYYIIAVYLPGPVCVYNLVCWVIGLGVYCFSSLVYLPCVCVCVYIMVCWISQSSSCLKPLQLALMQYNRDVCNYVL